MPKPWGLLPADVKALVLKREWRNFSNLKARLLNKKPFPIRIGLKPPTGQSAVKDMEHFRDFIRQWRGFPSQQYVEWDTRNYRTLSEQTLPKFFVLNNIQELIEFIGPEAAKQSRLWKTNMSPVLEAYPDTYPVLVKHLQTIESMRPSDARLLPTLIGQLQPGMVADKYLRALPLIGVDTKFVESYQPLIADILDTLHDDAITRTGGLHHWLGCHDNPKGWLTIRPLCETVKAKLGGLPILQLPGDVLKEQSLPATNILVVENMESGLGLPLLAGTVAVFGGGKNVAWMEASWLKHKRVAYWGDLDTWGLAILSDVRAKLPAVEALMMDQKTLTRHNDRIVSERKSVENIPEFLTEAETELFLLLKNADKKCSRLEQERLSPDYIKCELENWIKSSDYGRK